MVLESWVVRSFIGLGIACTLLHWGDSFPILKTLVMHVDTKKLLFVGVIGIFIAKAVVPYIHIR